MLVLIAESKSMSLDGTSQLPGTQPVYSAEAANIMKGLRGRTVTELSTLLHLGPKSAQRLFEEICNFNGTHTARAIDAYTGVVFRSLEAETLSPNARRVMEERVRIISSLYGWLRPSDMIKAYRLDYSMKAAPDGRNLAIWWRPLLTRTLVQEAKGRTVINLLPAEAAKCFNLKAVQDVAPIYTVKFVQTADDGTLRTPNSDHLKRLRAQFLRHILETEATIDTLRQLSTEDNNTPGELLIKV